jgi:hypothetical protein
MSCPGDMFDWFGVRRKVELVASNKLFAGQRSCLQQSFSVVFLVGYSPTSVLLIWKAILN